MPVDRLSGTPAPSDAAPRAPWVPPVLTPLPKLTELTLQTGAPIDGGGGPGGGGSTVIP